MNIRVAALEKYKCVRIDITLYTQLELVENMQRVICGSNGVTFVLSYFTDTEHNKIMLLLQNSVIGSSSKRCFEEFKDKIAQGPQVVHQVENVAELFVEAAQFCYQHGCSIGYSFASTF